MFVYSAPYRPENDEVLLHAQPLSKEGFGPYGDVIEIEGAKHFPINAGKIERYHDLARVELNAVQEDRMLVSILKCNEPSRLPYRVELVERHRLGSQAFIPLSHARMVIVVGPANKPVQTDQLEAFVSNGKQGINYRPGVWHMPLIAFDEDQRFLVVDRGGAGEDCEEFRSDDFELFVDYES